MSLLDVEQEMKDAINFLEPKIRGLQDLPKVSISNELSAVMNAKLVDYSRRHSLCASLLTAVENLLADGYPSLSITSISKELEDELDVQIADIESVRTLFEPEPVASNIVVNLGPTVDKP
jgi:hypothetical protein